MLIIQVPVTLGFVWDAVDTPAADKNAVSVGEQL